MISFFQKIAAKIISIIAGLIITMGIVETPSQYQPPLLDINKIETKEIQAEPKTKEKIENTPPLPAISLPITTPQQTEQPKEPPNIAPAPALQISLADLNKNSRPAIINILCTTKRAGAFRPITGSGIIISSKGIILINAHMGQYFLLENEMLAGDLNCIIRNGDIAQVAYDAKLIYIPSVWIENNIQTIIEQSPKGTGENDYAMLLINKSLIEGKELPASFPFAESNFNFNDLPENLSALVASYPAGFLGGISVQKDLGLISTFAPVKALYTFSELEPRTLDLFSLGGNIASQAGSSGGGVFDTRSGKLLGIVTTSGEGTTTATKILNAISIPHIARSFKQYTGQNLADSLNKPENFPDIFPETEFNRLKDLLLKQLKKL